MKGLQMQTMAQVQAESLDETVKGYVIGQQFLNDYTLVIDNDQDAYTEAIDTVNSLGTENIIYISNSFQTQFEDYISQVAEREEELGNTTGALLIKQLLLGYGSSTFDLIARHYSQTVKESN